MINFGRRIIYADVNKVTRDNLLDVLQYVMPVHAVNEADCNELWEYYKGNQPVLQRVKKIRPEICSKIVENRAFEIVTFKTGYLVGEPVQYVGRGEDINTKGLQRLNDFLFSEGKASKDKELADWFHICGTAYRIALPSRDPLSESPFKVLTADPRTTFVVYSTDIEHRQLMGVHFRRLDDYMGLASGGAVVPGGVVLSCYTEDRYFEVADGKIVRDEPLYTGIPIVEYPLNHARLGAFEIVMTLLDAINESDSNRLDDALQTVQSLLIFHNVKIGDQYDELRERGALEYADIDPQMKGEIKYISNPLDQSQGEPLVQHYYDSVLTICGMPNRNGGSSTSDTGRAVMLRDGWSSAEAMAKDTEARFKESELRFINLILRICSMARNGAGLNLKPSDIDIRFTRRNFENILEKAQVLDLMLNNNKIAPRLGFEHCGLFPDPDLAAKISEEHYEKVLASGQLENGDRADPQPGQPGGSSDRAGTNNGSGNSAPPQG